MTRISSVGGFLSGGNTTLMIGVETDRLQTALDVIREKSSRRHSVTVPSAGIPHPMETVAMPIQVTMAAPPCSSSMWTNSIGSKAKSTPVRISGRPECRQPALSPAHAALNTSQPHAIRRSRLLRTFDPLAAAPLLH